MHSPLRTVTGAHLPLLGWASRAPLDPAAIIDCELEQCLPAKPWGGLWTSPLEPDGTTTVWTRQLPTGLPQPTHLTVIAAHPHARVLLIDTDADTRALDAHYGFGTHTVPAPRSAWERRLDPRVWAQLASQRRIDWQRVAADHDAVHLTLPGLLAGRGAIPKLDWDVPSVWFARPAFATVRAGIELPRR